MTDTVIVRFEGDGSGVAELSWGHHEIWCVIRDKAFLYINDTLDVLCHELRADNHFVSPAGMAALMRRIAAVLVDAAVGDTAVEGAALADTAEGGTRTVPAMGTVR